MFQAALDALIVGVVLGIAAAVLAPRLAHRGLPGLNGVGGVITAVTGALTVGLLAFIVISHSLARSFFQPWVVLGAVVGALAALVLLGRWTAAAIPAT